VTNAAVVFARLDSSRLPGKALREIAGRTLLDRVVDKVLVTSDELPVIVATSDRAIDDPIAEHMTSRGIAVFRGDAPDVAGRALACADAYGLDRFARISGDSPFIVPSLITRAIERSLVTGADIVTNVFPRTYPVGVSIELITRDAMARIVAATDDPQDREHVTRYVYRTSEGFTIENLAAPDDRYLGTSLAVDNETDHARASWILENLGGRADLDAAVALAWEWENRK